MCVENKRNQTNFSLTFVYTPLFALAFHFSAHAALPNHLANSPTHTDIQPLPSLKKQTEVITSNGSDSITPTNDFIPHQFSVSKILTDDFLSEQSREMVPQIAITTLLNNPDISSNPSILDAGPTHYNAGLLILPTDYRVVGGGHYPLNGNLASGLVFEYGYSKYDYANSLIYENTTYDDSSHDATVLGQFYKLYQEYTIYVDGAFSFGKANHDIDANDMTSGIITFDNYNNKSNYRGAFIGSGYFYTLNNDIDVDTSIRYFYTDLEIDNASDSKGKFQLDSSSSSRVQLKKKINYHLSRAVSFSLAGIFDQQLDSSAKALIDGIPINATNENSSTGIVELGVQSKPFGSDSHLGVGLTFRAYTGQRSGVDTFASAIYRF